MRCNVIGCREPGLYYAIEPATGRAWWVCGAHELEWAYERARLECRVQPVQAPGPPGERRPEVTTPLARCPRCGGRVLVQYGELWCIACGSLS